MKLVKCNDTEKAYEVCPWATVIVKTDRGCLCFEDIGHYEKWKNRNN